MLTLYITEYKIDIVLTIIIAIVYEKYRKYQHNITCHHREACSEVMPYRQGNQQVWQTNQTHTHTHTNTHTHTHICSVASAHIECWPKERNNFVPIVKEYK